MRFTDVQIGEAYRWRDKPVIAAGKHPPNIFAGRFRPMIEVRFAHGSTHMVEAGGLTSEQEWQDRKTRRDAQAAFKQRAVRELAAAAGDGSMVRELYHPVLYVTFSALLRLLDQLDARPVPTKDHPTPANEQERLRRQARLSMRLRRAAGCGRGAGSSIPDGYVAGIMLPPADAVALAQRLTGDLPARSALADLLGC